MLLQSSKRSQLKFLTKKLVEKTNMCDRGEQCKKFDEEEELGDR